MIPYLNPALISVAVAGIAGLGWMSRGWFEDSKDLAAMEAQQALAAEIREGQAEMSRQVADHLNQFDGTERVIDRGVIREIQKPVFRNVCIPPDGDAFRLLNLIAIGEATGVPDGEMPEGSTSSD